MARYVPFVFYGILDRMGEKWRPVVGYESYYEVSDLGRIRSLGRMVRKGRGQSWMESHVLRGTLSLDGRRVVMLCVNGTKSPRYVAPVVLEAFAGPSPPGTECCHWDGDSTNDTLANLRWGSSKENSADQLRHGRHGMAIRTHCPRGHSLFPPNLAPNARGARQCRACACAYSWAHGRGIHRTDPRWIREADRQYSRIMSEGRRGPRKDNAKKTSCPRGHRLVAPNLVNQSGRGCLACGRTHSWARKRGIQVSDPGWIAEADRRYVEIMASSDQAVMHTA